MLKVLSSNIRAIRGVQNEHSERLNRIELRLSVMEQTLGSLYALSGSDREPMNSVIRRVEKIEQRLELSNHSALHHQQKYRFSHDNHRHFKPYDSNTRRH